MEINISVRKIRVTVKSEKILILPVTVENTKLSAFYIETKGELFHPCDRIFRVDWPNAVPRSSKMWNGACG